MSFLLKKDIPPAKYFIYMLIYISMLIIYDTAFPLFFPANLRDGR